MNHSVYHERRVLRDLTSKTKELERTKPLSPHWYVLRGEVEALRKEVKKFFKP